MKIIDLYKRKKPVFSFEIFPPKMDTPIETIYNKLDDFTGMKPDFISVTYGAGGTSKDRTIEIASKLKNEYGTESLAHFTCVGHNIEDINAMLKKMEESGLENLVALRGDPPANAPDFDFGRNVFSHANELISYINSMVDLCIAAAAYPEGHASSPRISYDMNHLKMKVETGVDFLITQLFFDNKVFYDFLEKCEVLNITCPISAGIMPMFKADQIKRIALLSRVSLPAKLVVLMDKYEDHPEDMLKAGMEYAAEQIADLVKNNVDGIHLYTMNRPKSSRKILELAGLLSS